MVVRESAAPPTPWSQNLAEPQIDKSAYVHSFSNLIGDVKVGANVLIAPGTSIRADEGTPFAIGESTNIQDGVVIHGLEQGRVVGDDGNSYSVWIGKRTCITHVALVHGPAYIGDDCFIGFRSTVFNARVGHGCIVMMHALIQDVEIPAGKYVPSGAVITSQDQADRLPDVMESDRAFASHVVKINEALRVGYQCAENSACITPIRQQIHSSEQSNQDHSKTQTIGTMSLNGEVLDQVRSLLNQGCKISTEHANERRFKTKSWLTGATLEGNRADQILAQLESTLAAHPGEYVRLIGVDPTVKRRVLEAIVQRPGSSQPSQSKNATVAYNSSRSAAPSGNVANQSIGGDINQQIRSLLQQGYKIGIESADQRHFRAKSWTSCGAIDSTREGDVIRAIESTLAAHAGEYVRLIGIDTKQKRRVLETIIQRPGEQAATSRASSNASYSSSSNGSVASAGVTGDIAQQVRSLLQQGYKIGTEHADIRHFRAKSWTSCSPIDSTRENEVLRALDACLAEHAGEYVRLIGIDTKFKRRVVETIIQRPGNQAPRAAASSSAPTPSYSSFSGNSASASVGNGKSGLSADTIQQIRALLQQGYKIGTEHADQRHFKAKSWTSCSPIDSTREGDVIRALEACIADHAGEYVRLFGINAKEKRRVAEKIIQRP